MSYNFQLNPDNWRILFYISEYVYLVSSLDVGTYTLMFELMDSCYNVAFDTITVKVYNTVWVSFGTIYVSNREQQNTQ